MTCCPTVIRICTASAVAECSMIQRLEPLSDIQSADASSPKEENFARTAKDCLKGGALRETSHIFLGVKIKSRALPRISRERMRATSEKCCKKDVSVIL